MNDATGKPLDACELLATIEAMLDTLADLITRQDTTATGHQVNHHDTEDLPHE